MSFHGHYASFVGSGGWLWASLAGGGGLFLGGGGGFHGQLALSQSNNIAHLLMCHVIGCVLVSLVTWLATLLLSWLVVVVSGW